MKSKFGLYSSMLLGIVAFVFFMAATVLTFGKDIVSKTGIITESTRLISPYLIALLGFISPLLSVAKPHVAGYTMVIIGIISVVPGVIFENVLAAVPSAILYIIAGINLIKSIKPKNKYE